MPNYVEHTFGPLHDSESRVLILGTIPSPKSREAGFYYAHPQNRFWPVLAAVYGEETPMGTAARAAFAHRHRIALWDVLASCEISGAADSTICRETPNDLAVIFQSSSIRAVFTTGKKAHALYVKYGKGLLEDICLPSPSAANCAVHFDRLKAAYGEIKIFTDAE